MIREDCKELNVTLQEATNTLDAGQESVETLESDHRCKDSLKTLLKSYA